MGESYNIKSIDDGQGCKITNPTYGESMTLLLQTWDNLRPLSAADAFGAYAAAVELNSHCTSAPTDVNPKPDGPDNPQHQEYCTITNGQKGTFLFAGVVGVVQMTASDGNVNITDGFFGVASAAISAAIASS